MKKLFFFDLPNFIRRPVNIYCMDIGEGLNGQILIHKVVSNYAHSMLNMD